MPRYDSWRYDCGHSRRPWRRRRRPKRDTAGIALIAMFAFMALHQLGRAPAPVDAPAKPAISSLATPQPMDSPPVAPPEDATPVPPAAPSELAESEPAGEREPAQPKKQGDDTRPAEPAGLDAPDGCADDECRQAYSQFLMAMPGKAFVLAGDGQGFWVGGEVSVSEAIRRAQQRCQQVTGLACQVAEVMGTPN